MIKELQDRTTREMVYVILATYITPQLIESGLSVSSAPGTAVQIVSDIFCEAERKVENEERLSNYGR